MKTSHAILLAALLLNATAFFFALRSSPSTRATLLAALPLNAAAIFFALRSSPSTRSNTSTSVASVETKAYQQITTALLSQLTSMRINAFTDGQRLEVSAKVDDAFWKAHAEQERYLKTGPEDMRQASYERFVAISKIQKELNQTLHSNLAAKPD